MNILVIGYGSIGSRHARILREMNHQVSVVSKHSQQWEPRYSNLYEAFSKEHPQYVIIANKTTEHLQTYNELVDLQFRGKVLVEKPLFTTVVPKISHHFSQLCVAYNLRFHPIIQRIREELHAQKVLSVQGYAGQYLPSWRPQQDYRNSYSAIKAEGGGVLRDLSHEIDYLLWLFGTWKSVVAEGGRYSNLEVETEDCITALFTTQNCPSISLQLNYLDKIGQRKMIINTENDTLYADLISGTLVKNSKVLLSQTLHRDDTYKRQHEAMINNTNSQTLCSEPEGLQVVEMIDAIENSITNRKWIDS